MITFSPEYKEKLWEIQNMNLLKQAVLVPHNEKILNIDLDKRTIEAPPFLSVSQDHESETIYFKFDRFYDMVDLTGMICIIQYKNANGEEYFYPVPFYDTTTYLHEGNKVLIPWCIQGPATAYAGTVEFSILFFRLDPDQNIIYQLNTLPAKSKVLQGQNWKLNEMHKDQVTIDDNFLYNIQRILDTQDRLNLYWVEV